MLRRFGKKLVILPQSYILCINVFDGQKILKQYNLFIRLMTSLSSDLRTVSAEDLN